MLTTSPSLASAPASAPLGLGREWARQAIASVAASLRIRAAPDTLKPDAPKVNPSFMIAVLAPRGPNRAAAGPYRAA